MDAPSVPQKQCTKCKQWFPSTIEYFRTDNRMREKLSSHCRECQRKAALDYYWSHCDQQREQHKRYIAENYARKLEYNRQYRKKHEQRLRNSRINNHAEIRKQELVAEKRYRNTHQAKLREKEKRYRKANPENGRIYTHLRRARKNRLPSQFTAKDWQHALDYFGGCCAVCGRPLGLWHILAKEHWIPLTDPRPDNPGTTPGNIIPLCHSIKDGTGGCNNTKSNKDPVVWLVERFGKRKAKQIQARIQQYFDSLT